MKHVHLKLVETHLPLLWGRILIYQSKMLNCRISQQHGMLNLTGSVWLKVAADPLFASLIWA